MAQPNVTPADGGAPSHMMYPGIWPASIALAAQNPGVATAAGPPPPPPPRTAAMHAMSMSGVSPMPLHFDMPSPDPRFTTPIAALHPTTMPHVHAMSPIHAMGPMPIPPPPLNPTAEALRLILALDPVGLRTVAAAANQASAGLHGHGGSNSGHRGSTKWHPQPWDDACGAAGREAKVFLSDCERCGQLSHTDPHTVLMFSLKGKVRDQWAEEVDTLTRQGIQLTWAEAKDAFMRLVGADLQNPFLTAVTELFEINPAVAMKETEDVTTYTIRFRRLVARLHEGTASESLLVVLFTGGLTATYREHLARLHNGQLPKTLLEASKAVAEYARVTQIAGTTPARSTA